MPVVSNNNDNQWESWSKYLIEGIKSIQDDISTLFELQHKYELSSTEKSQNILTEMNNKLQELQLKTQEKINSVVVEVTKIQVRTALFSGFLGAVLSGGISFLVYLIVKLISGSK